MEENQGNSVAFGSAPQVPQRPKPIRKRRVSSHAIFIISVSKLTLVFFDLFFSCNFIPNLFANKLLLLTVIMAIIVVFMICDLILYVFYSRKGVYLNPDDAYAINVSAFTKSMILCVIATIPIAIVTFGLGASIVPFAILFCALTFFVSFIGESIVFAILGVITGKN